jgi:hypothetical protein
LSVEHVVLELLKSTDVVDFVEYSGLQTVHLRSELQNQINLLYEHSQLRKFKHSISGIDNPSSLYALLKILSLNSWTKQHLSRSSIDYLSLMMYAESKPNLPADVLNTLKKYKSIVEQMLGKNLEPKVYERDFVDFHSDEDRVDFEKIIQDDSLCKVSSVTKPTLDETGTAIACIDGKNFQLEFELLQRLDEYSVSIVKFSQDLTHTDLRLLESLIKESLDRGDDVTF